MAKLASSQTRGGRQRVHHTHVDRSTVVVCVLFVFYEYKKDAELYLFDHFKTFLSSRGGEVEHFYAKVQARHYRERSQHESIKLIQHPPLSSKTYEGEVDGVRGWRTKLALQKFLQSQAYYSSDIDDVFGNRTLDGLTKYREMMGLSAEPVTDLTLAQAVSQCMTPTLSPSQ